MHIMRPILWGLHHVQGFNFHQLYQPNHHILLRGLKWCIQLHPSYLLVINVVILPTKLTSVTFLPNISFVIIVGRRDIRKLSWNKSNSDYHDKICQHLLLPLNQKPRHFSFPFRLSPPTVILVRTLKRKNKMLIIARCFKPMLFKFKLCKINLNHWRPNLLI
jgi:hypothetical protein